MGFDFKLPDIGEGVVEGEIVTWHLQEGAAVQEDDPLVEVMTDKATVTIPSPRTGTISKIFFQEGDIAPVGELLVSIATDGSSASAPAAAATPAPATRATPVKAAPAAATGATTGRRALATPATRKLARELGVNIQDVPGTGPGNRVTREDVQAFAGQESTPVAAAPSAARPVQQAPIIRSSSPAPAAPTRPTPTPSAPRAPSDGSVERVPIRGLRKVIFESMARSKHTAAHFTYVEEVDMTRLVNTRTRLKGRAEKAGIRLTYLPFIMKAVTLGLADFPNINGTIDDERMELVKHSLFNLSIAVSTDAGLTVPVIQDVGSKSIFELATELADLGVRAKEGRLRREEFQNGGFTITSLGALGGMFATPIVNYPEVGILGIHKIEDRPVVIDGEIVVRKRMYLSSSFDHRVIDGHVGAGFVQRVKDLLEDPDALLLELR